MPSWMTLRGAVIAIDVHGETRIIRTGECSDPDYGGDLVTDLIVEESLGKEYDEEKTIFKKDTVWECDLVYHFFPSNHESTCDDDCTVDVVNPIQLFLNNMPDDMGGTEGRNNGQNG